MLCGAAAHGRYPVGISSRRFQCPILSLILIVVTCGHVDNRYRDRHKGVAENSLPLPLADTYHLPTHVVGISEIVTVGKKRGNDTIAQDLSCAVPV